MLSIWRKEEQREHLSGSNGGLGEEETLTQYAKKKNEYKCGSLRCYPYMKQNLLITSWGWKGKGEDLTILF